MIDLSTVAYRSIETTTKQQPRLLLVIDRIIFSPSLFLLENSHGLPEEGLGTYESGLGGTSYRLNLPPERPPGTWVINTLMHTQKKTSNKPKRRCKVDQRPATYIRRLAPRENDIERYEKEIDRQNICNAIWGLCPKSCKICRKVIYRYVPPTCLFAIWIGTLRRVLVSECVSWQTRYLPTHTI